MLIFLINLRAFNQNRGKRPSDQSMTRNGFDYTLVDKPTSAVNRTQRIRRATKISFDDRRRISRQTQKPFLHKSSPLVGITLLHSIGIPYRGCIQTGRAKLITKKMCAGSVGAFTTRPQHQPQPKAGKFLRRKHRLNFPADEILICPVRWIHNLAWLHFVAKYHFRW